MTIRLPDGGLWCTEALQLVKQVSAVDISDDTLRRWGRKGLYGIRVKKIGDRKLAYFIDPNNFRRYLRYLTEWHSAQNWRSCAFALI